nr:Asparaginase glutaminase and Ankyrin domain containing protein [Haemonchus contortus]
MFRIGPLPKIKIDDGPEEDVERILTETHGIPHYAWRKASLPTTMLSRKPLDESHMPKTLKIHDGSIMRNVSATNLVHELQEAKTCVATSPINAPSALPESRVLCLYTGGTIGMKSEDGVYSPKAGYLPQVLRTIPPLNDKKFIDQNFANCLVKPYALPPVRFTEKRVVYWIVEYEPLLDSCDMTFDDWIRIASDIKKAYHNYDGFVVLHGTDTLAYTASALSFMMENLGKPVIITGSQIPVAEVRSDGMENLIGALVVAANFDIPEVCVYFNNKLMRGNRTIKLDNAALEAFDSPNMHPLAKMDIKIKVYYDSIFRNPNVNPFTVHDNLCRDVGLLRIFPSMSIESVRAFLKPPTKGVILQTFGAGNMPTRRKDIIEALTEAINRGCLIVNCSQCVKGQVDVNYATGKVLYDIGVIPGSDMTSEAAMAKMCYVLGKDEWDHETKRMMLQANLRGEMTVTNQAVAMRELDIIPHIARCLRLSSGTEVQLIRDTILPPLVCSAAKTNKVEILKSIKESGVNFSVCDYNLRTALHVAATSGNLEAVRYLLSIGANVHVKDLFGYNPLLCAVKAKALPCVVALRDAGGIIDIPPYKLGVDLCLAAAHGDVEQLKCWEAAGSDLSATDYDKRTALHVAVTHNQPEAVRYLLEKGVDPYAVDEFGTTPFSEAKRKNYEAILNELKSTLEQKANLTRRKPVPIIENEV